MMTALHPDIIVLQVIFLAAEIFAATEWPGCHTGTIRSGGSLFFLPVFKATWKNSSLYCKKHGAHLATVLDERTFILLSEKLQEKGVYEAFLGAFKDRNFISVYGQRASCGKSKRNPVERSCCFGRKQKGKRRMKTSVADCVERKKFSCAKRVQRKIETWRRAREICFHQGKGLYVGNLAPARWKLNTEYWIGISNREWIWESSRKLINHFQNWSKLHHQHKQKQNCLMMKKKKKKENYVWVPEICTEKKRFVCELVYKESEARMDTSKGIIQFGLMLGIPLALVFLAITVSIVCILCFCKRRQEGMGLPEQQTMANPAEVETPHNSDSQPPLIYNYIENPVQSVRKISVVDGYLLPRSKRVKKANL